MKWDERYATPDYVYGRKVNEFLQAQAAQLPSGRILSLGEGEGRNAVFLAQQGFRVCAVDASAVGLEKARTLAAEQGVEIETVRAELADFELGEEQWDGIVSIFCHLPPETRRKVHHDVARALKPNGVFLLEAYTPKQLEFGTGGPPAADLLLDADTLRDELWGMQFQLLQETEREVLEGSLHTGLGSVLQAIAVKPRRRYQVSSNRGSAVHKVRYVESGGGEDDANCGLCQPRPKPR